MQGVKEILRMAVRRKFTHLLTALLLKVALARTEPNESSVAVNFSKVFLDKINKNNRFTRSCGGFYGNRLLAVAVGNEVYELEYSFFLKIK